MLHRYLPTKGKVLKWRIFRHRAWHEPENQIRQKGRSTCIRLPTYCLSTYLPACKLLKPFCLRQMAGGLAAFAGPELLVGSVNAPSRFLHVHHAAARAASASPSVMACAITACS